MIPAAAAADLAAGLDIYRALTPPDRATATEAAQYGLAFLAAAGWHITSTATSEGPAR